MIRITHKPSGTVLAEGPKGWRMMPLEGDWYIHRDCLRTDAFRNTAFPGPCFYKGLCLWLKPRLPGASRMLAWRYVLPYPWTFFLWGRFGLPGNDPDILVENAPAVEPHIQPCEQGLTREPTSQDP